MTLILHYAPDNASLCVRLALETLGAPYGTTLVDRSTQEQCSPAYRALNPAGHIPTLTTPDGPIFETAAILLWLSDRHPGALLPDDGTRGRALSWLFWLSNTLHPALIGTHHPERLPPAAPEAVRTGHVTRIRDALTLLDDHAEELHPLHDCYLAPMLRWLALYGGNDAWFDLNAFPALRARASAVEATPAATACARAEGLGPTPFTAPRLPEPPEGVAK